MVTGRFAPLTFRPLDVSAPSLDVSPLGRFAPWTFRPLDVSPPGRFDTWTFRPLTGRFAPDCGRFAPNVTDGWTDRIAINISHKCGDTR